MLAKRDLLRSCALATITITAAKPVPVQAQTTGERPGFFKAKDIAEAGYIYGLPIVMNYAVMYDYAVDRNSGQFKAPFNEIKNEPRVYTYKDRNYHAKQRHAVFDPLDGPAHRTDGALRPGRREIALLFGDAQRRQHLQLRLHRQPCHGQ